MRKTFAGVTALPTSFIVDRKSRIAMRHVGMLTAAVTEAETRHLAGLPVNASVEEIEKDRPTKLANAAQTTEIPGVDLKALPKDKRVAAIQKLNDEACTCGCNLTRRALPRGRPELSGQPPARERDRRGHRQRQLKRSQEVQEVRGP